MESYRKCPSCDRRLTYSKEANLLKAIKNNSVCISCRGDVISSRMKGRFHSLETREKISRALLGNENGASNKGQIPWCKGKKMPKEFGEKISKALTGRTLTEEHIRNMRIARIANINRLTGQLSPNYNPSSIPIIEGYGKQHDYNFQHAENGGEFHIKELGYWVDGYDEEKNVVIEYYEPWHSKQKKRDTQRKQEIIEYLGCDFIEIGEV